MEVEGESSASRGLQESCGHSRQAKRASAFFPPYLSLSSSISSPSFSSSSSSFFFSFFVLLLLARIAHSQPQCGIAAGNALCPNNLCCSRFGFCGNTIDFCGAGCQSNCVLREPSLEGFRCPLTPPTPKPYTGKACRTRVRIRPVGVGSGGVVSNPGERGAICSPRVDISECQLYEIMGGRFECPNCRFYYPFIIKAMADFDLNCPDRIAAFLATIRHETDALRTLFQPADCGGGGIHMLPQNFPLFLSGRGKLPELRRQFDRIFRRGFRVGANTTCARELLCASRIAQLPENAFVTSAWWFRIGSRRALGAQGCRDLRRDADVGLGVPQQQGANGTTTVGATGFYKISRCVFGSLPDAGLPQRVRYYEEARRVTDRLK